jgi:UDP-2,4-diacetamido-2,4,6-trideoxy-beta-L-altropyranose hydrolase
VSRTSVKVAIRVDSSLEMGTGHVMRCLTLAEALSKKGAICVFLCRRHPGNFIARIRANGYQVYSASGSGTLEGGVSSANLSGLMDSGEVKSIDPAHANWLGVTQRQDSDSWKPLLLSLAPDWLIVDHYSLDARWENWSKPRATRLMVIDDLADRVHDCDLLLDQNLARKPKDYHPLVPSSCRLLTGSQYALLRPEFIEERKNRQACNEGRLNHLFINMGGVDSQNATGQILVALTACRLPKNVRITVIMGAQAPWLQDVRRNALKLPWATQVHVNVTNMAALMADADLAIGAAGSTAWERCCLGLPTLMLVLAENQRFIAEQLNAQGAAISLGWFSQTDTQWSANLKAEIEVFDRFPEKLAALSNCAVSLVDGQGVFRVVSEILEMGNV